MYRKTTLGFATLALLTTSQAGAQEMFSLNFWSIGKPSSSLWTSDPTAAQSLQLDGTLSAGAPGYETTDWQNVDFGFPFNSSTAPFQINGDNGSTATFEFLNRRGSGPYQWNPATEPRDTSDELPANTGNANLLNSKAHGTEYDQANGTGNPFGYMIIDAEATGIPFAKYNVVVYLANQAGQQSGDRNGFIRINDEVVRPTDLSGGYRNGVVADGGLSMAGGTEFLIPATAQGYEPDGVLDEVESSGDTGNYIVFEGLTDPTFKFQAWGVDFNHLGVAGLQIMQASSDPGLPGDTDGDGDVDDSDLGTSFSNYTGPVGDVGKTAADGDNDGDGDVDDSDLGTSFSNYTGPIAVNVPEPTSLALLGLGGLLAARRRRA